MLANNGACAMLSYLNSVPKNSDHLTIKVDIKYSTCFNTPLYLYANSVSYIKRNKKAETAKTADCLPFS